MLKVKGHFKKRVMTDTLETLRKGLFEEWGISNEVTNMTNKFLNDTQNILDNTKWGYCGNLNVKYCKFRYSFWKRDFEVEVYIFNYSSDIECIRAKDLKKFNSMMNYKDGYLTLNLGTVFGEAYPPAYDDIVKHEIQHIYKIYKGGDIKSSDSLLGNSSMFNEEFYNKLLDIMDTFKNYKIRKLAYALYSSFEFERNGFIGGLDGVFSKMEVDRKDDEDGFDRIEALRLTECYKAYENILKILEFIDDMDDKEIHDIFGYYKHKIKKILEISENKYKRGISKILLKYSKVWGK